MVVLELLGVGGWEREEVSEETQEEGLQLCVELVFVWFVDESKGFYELSGFWYLKMLDVSDWGGLRRCTEYEF